MTRLDLNSFLLCEVSALDSLIGSGILIFITLVTALVIITVIKVLFQVWLIKYVRSLNKNQFKRVIGVLRPLHDMDVQNIIVDVLKKLRG